MSLSEGSILYGNSEIQFSVCYVKRKTLEISVHPNTDVVIRAPVKADLMKIRKIILKRAKWIIKQQAYFRKFSPRTPARQYISGETHLYLGKQYRLRIEESNIDSVKLTRGYLKVQVKPEASPDKVKQVLKKWYSEKAVLKIREILDECWRYFEEMNLEKPKLQIRKMKTRWGSLSHRETLTLNSNLIKAPKECIEYVIIHELCHLTYHDHSTGFYDLLEKILPDWEKIKHKLEVKMA